MSYIFGGNTGLTYEDAQSRRKIAEQLRAQNISSPKNVGEGIQAVARAYVARGSERQAAKAETRLKGEFSDSFDALMGGSSPKAPASTQGFAPSGGGAASDSDMSSMIAQAANRMGMDPLDLATVISYETAGTFDPTKAGPTTQWGQHRGLIQFGEPQAQQYGVDWNNPLQSQLGEGGAVERYFQSNGYRPGMGFEDIYSIVNAGAPGLGHRTDENNGGAPGTVAEKVAGMGDHRAKAARLMGGSYTPQSGGGQANYGRMNQIADLMSNPMASEGQKAVLNAMLQQSMPRQPMSQLEQIQLQKAQLDLNDRMNPQVDPMDAIELERARLELDQMRNPTPEPGYTTLAPEQVAELGLPEGNYQQGPDGKISTIGGGGQNVTINNGEESGQWGDAPKDHVWLRDENGEVITEPDPSGRGSRPVAVPVAGGPDDNSADAAGAATKAQDAVDLIDSIIKDPALASITGMVQGRIAPMTQAGTDLNVKIDQVKGQAFLQAFESLKGGGQITEREGIAAQNAMARLNRAQSTEAYVEALTELQTIMQRAVERGGGAMPKPSIEITPSAFDASQLNTPADINAAIAEYGDVSEIPPEIRSAIMARAKEIGMY